MIHTIQKSERLNVVDALRGFALLAIVLLHNLEHYNIYFIPEFQPAWLQALDKWMWDSFFFLFSGKAYAIFSLLFGFSFYIQFHHAEQKGIDFWGRFAWRLVLLFLFAQLHALFYNGDILVLYAVAGFVLIPVCKLKDKIVFWIAVFLLLQPFEWGRMLYALSDPDYVAVGNRFMIYSERVGGVTMHGSFWEVLRSNIWDGQLYSNFWQVENGRLFQTSALFMFGMLLGRNGSFIRNDRTIGFWKRILGIGILAFIPFYLLRFFVPEHISNPSVLLPYKIITQSLGNFAFMLILVSIFVLIWFKKENGGNWQKFIIPYGRMSLTNYISQSIIGVCIYYGFGLGLYRVTGATETLFIGLAIFTVQWIFSRYWLSCHKQGPLEYLWKQGTWIGSKNNKKK